MQESKQTQQKDTMVVIDDEAIICDICGDIGFEKFLALCSKCGDGAEHTYCMHVLLEDVPEGDWRCEGCMASSNRVKPKTRTEGASSTSLLPAKRCGVPLKAQAEKKSRVTGLRVQRTKTVNSQLQISYHSQDKAKGPRGCCDKGMERMLEIGSDEKRRDLKTMVTLPEASKQSNQSLASRRPTFKSSGKIKIAATGRVSFAKQSSSGFLEKTELSKLGSQTKIARDECSLLKSGSSKSVDLKFKAGTEKGGSSQKQKVERNLASGEARNQKNVRTASRSVSSKMVSSDKSNATCSEAILENGYRPMVFKNSRTAEETNATTGKCVSKLDYPTLCLPAPVPSGVDSKDFKFKAGMVKGGCLQKQKAERYLASGETRNRKNVRTVSKSVSSQIVSSEKSNACEAILENDIRPMVFKNLRTAEETNTTKGRYISKLDYPTMYLPPPVSSGVVSKNFKIKAGMVKGGRLQKQKFESNVGSGEIAKRKIVRTASKSVPLKSVSSEKLNTTYSDVFRENAVRSAVLKNSISAQQTDTNRGKYVSKLGFPSMCLPASVPSATKAKIGNKVISPDETFSGPNFGRLDAGQSSGQLDCRLQRYSCTNYDDLNCLSKKKNQSRIAEQPAEGATAIKGHKLSTGLGSSERSQFGAVKPFKHIVIPEIESIWIGNFRIKSNEGITGQCDGFQAHLSTCAPQNVLELVEKFPEIVVLEELPRLKMWPSQFMESQVTEENIALYFFAQDRLSYGRYYQKLVEYMTKNDLALKGNIDGVELLIFPSDVLPESQCWNRFIFLWGIFDERNVHNAEKTPESSHRRKRESRDIARGNSLDLNAYADEDSGYAIVRYADARGKLPVEKKNNADNVKARGKQAMNVEKDGERVKALSKETAEVENSAAIEYGPWVPRQHERKAAENLVLLSKGRKK